MKDRNAPRLRAVLEGLLEDQLLDEPAQLHFALQPGARTDAPTWVAVCDRAWLRGALAALQQAGQAPHRVVPEWVPEMTEAQTPHDTPCQSKLWVTGAQDAARLVWTDATGVHRLPVSSHALIPGALPPQLAQHAELLAEPAVAQLAEQLFQRAARVVTPTERLVAAARTDWDLAQFDMARRNPWLTRLTETLGQLWSAPQWRAARWATVAIGIVQVLGLNVFAWHAQSHLTQQRSAVTSTLTTTFPAISVVVDAPLQMERAVAALRQSNGASSPRDLEALLGAYGAASPQAPANQAPTAIDFAAGELRLTGAGHSTEQVATLDAAVRSQGFSSRIEGDTLVLQARSAP
jgi:general secretion pathway protein L